VVYLVEDLANQRQSVGRNDGLIDGWLHWEPGRIWRLLRLESGFGVIHCIMSPGWRHKIYVIHEVPALGGMDLKELR